MPEIHKQGELSGIDIGKNVDSLMNEQGKTVFKAFSFPNSTEGGEALFARARLCI